MQFKLLLRRLISTVCLGNNLLKHAFMEKQQCVGYLSTLPLIINRLTVYIVLGFTICHLIQQSYYKENDNKNHTKNIPNHNPN